MTKNNSFIKRSYYLHIGKIRTPNIIYKIWVYFTAPPKVFSLKNLWTIEARLLWYPSYFGLLTMLNALSRNTLSEVVFLRQIFKPCHVESKFYLIRFDKYIMKPLFFASSKWYTSTVNLGRLKCISRMTLSPANKNIFTISSISYFVLTC